MTSVQIHLALNHVPLFLSILGSIILMLGMIKKNESFKKLSLYLLVTAAIFTVPVFLTGEGTEELVERLPGVNEPGIEEHEEMAKISLIVIIITGTIALAGLLVKKNAIVARVILIAVIILSLVSFGTMAQTAHLGGLIRHSELSNSPTVEGQENTVRDNPQQLENPQRENDD